ncbi:gap junction beta-7 protein [Carlito syrichta]|uniref:Gap junction beta-7 protein n=1 Tax=Carlito syrichta TaxID=1868482 RepID=A0A3Q0EE38_CARSF|nr:gap junction beta-7 protein [Carlito syrichta]
MSWTFPRGLLGGVNKYSTGIGRIWLVVMFVFRVLLYVVPAKQVWKDEQKEFECNIGQPGCENVCFDYFFPISQGRLWALQLIMVSTPSLLVVLHEVYCENRELRHQKKLYVSPGTMDGGLRYSYLISLMVKIGLEIGFLALFYKLYHGFSVPYLMKCAVKPCPNTVDCFIPKPTEKTIFILFLVITSCLCTVLTVAELSFLVLKCFMKCCPPNSSPLCVCAAASGALDVALQGCSFYHCVLLSQTHLTWSTLKLSGSIEQAVASEIRKGSHFFQGHAVN